MNKIIIACLILSATATAPTTARAGFTTADFTDTGAISGVNQFNNQTGGFMSGGQYFNNTYHTDYQYATGFSASSMKDTTTPGAGNQYAAITGGGFGDAYYAVLTPFAYVNLSGLVQSIEVTNTTYAYLSMLNGDTFNKKFTTGNFFDVVITGYSGTNDSGTSTGSTKVTLADYASPTDTPLQAWSYVDLTVLGPAKSLGFSFLSNDTNAYGITVPEYVAVDNLITFSAVPEPSSWRLCLAGLGIGLGAMGGRLRLARRPRV